MDSMDESSLRNAEAVRESLFERRQCLSDGFSPRLSTDQKEKPDAVSSKWDVSVSARRFSDQEDMLVEDLLYCMQGIEGENVRIRPSSSPLQLVINPHFDESIRELAGRIVSVCSDYHSVVQHVERIAESKRWGAVSRAFAAACKMILEEYHLYVAQLESCQFREGLSLQKMWYHMQPVQHALKLLAEACRPVEEGNIRGGALLTYLYSKCDEFAGDTKAREMFAFLLTAAAKPYFDQLVRWVYSGELVDDKGEFMIVFNVEEKRRRASGTAFDEIDDWERRYAVNRSMCPSFLSPVAEKILNSGKYLNIVSSCGRRVDSLSSAKLQFTPHERRYLRTIEDAYAEAGRALVSLLIDDYEFVSRLKSLKHFFLIDRGDWLVHFMENAETELSNVVGNIVPHRVANFLALAFNLSSVAEDPLKEQIRFELRPKSLTNVVLEIVRIRGGLEPIRTEQQGADERANGYDAFALCYDADWPLSIVFNKDAMFKYQIVFRQLLAFKHIERQLSRAWISRRSNSHQAILLHKLVTFARKFLYHASVDVLEPYWQRLMDAIVSRREIRERQSTFTLDDLLREHNLFLDSCMADLLLTEEPLILCVEKIVELCKEAVKHVEAADEDIDVDFMEQEYAATVEDLLAHMRSLSNTRREKSWLDVAYSLGLVTV